MTLFIEMTHSYDPTKKLSLRLRPCRWWDLEQIESHGFETLF